MQKDSGFKPSLLVLVAFILAFAVGIATSAEPRAVDTFPVTINYKESLADMIGAGKFDEVDPDSRKLVIAGKGTIKTEVVVINFSRDVSGKEVIAAFTKLGLEPAKVEHAAALGKNYPDIQRKYPVVFLGSVRTNPEGRSYVPYLNCFGFGEKRWFEMDRWYDGWGTDFRFAGVRSSKR
jgi:hypothetical protein